MDSWGVLDLSSAIIGAKDDANGKKKDKKLQKLDIKLNGSLDSNWQFTKIIQDTDVEVGGMSIPSKNGKLSDSTKALMKQRRDAKNNPDRMSRLEYVELCKTIRKKIKMDIQKHNGKLVQDAIENNKSYKKATQKLFIGRKQILAMSDSNTRITNRDSILEFIADFYQKLYTPPQNDCPLIQTYNNEEPPVVLTTEVEMALKDMKNGKAAGHDGITTELLKLTGNKTLSRLPEIYLVSENGTFPITGTKQL